MANWARGDGLGDDVSHIDDLRTRSTHGGGTSDGGNVGRRSGSAGAVSRHAGDGTRATGSSIGGNASGVDVRNGRRRSTTVVATNGSGRGSSVSLYRGDCCTSSSRGHVVSDVLRDGLGAGLSRPLSDGRGGGRRLAIGSTRASVGITLVVPGSGSGQTEIGRQIHVSAGLHLG